MDHKHTLTELNNCSREELITMVLSMQGQLDMLNQNIEKLIEQQLSFWQTYGNFKIYRRTALLF